MGVTLGLAEVPERIPYAREPRRLPVVLSANEVVRFLESVPSLKARAALTAAYAAGLRVSEVTALRVADLDSGRMMIRIEHGKGGKERYVMLSAQLLAILRTYWRLSRPEHWLFPGRDATRPIEPTTLHAACRSARAAAGIGKKVTVGLLKNSIVSSNSLGAPDVWARLGPIEPRRCQTGGVTSAKRCLKTVPGTLRDPPEPVVGVAASGEGMRAGPACGGGRCPQGGLRPARGVRREGFGA
jgi:hypothetical protein